MNTIQIFINNEFGEIRTLEENGKPLFCGSDVAKALGYGNDPDSWITLLTALKDERKQKQQLQLQAAEDKPKVIFADAVSASDGTILIGELAKILKGNGIQIGQNRLFEQLRREGYLIKRKGTDYNAPTQMAMELELFKVKETAITHSDGHVTISKTTKVTGKGQQYFINRFLGAQSAMHEERGAVWA